jgi:hypothetical protein
MFSSKGNQGLGSYEPLIKRLMENRLLKKKVQISSDKEAEDLLSKLLKEFKSGLDSKNKKKQAILIWAFREYLEKKITFDPQPEEV